MIYLIQNVTTDDIKIGISKNPLKRLSQLQTGNGDKLILLGVYEVGNDRAIEKRLHKMFWQSRQKGEWFRFPEPEFYVKFLDDYLTELTLCYS